VQEPDDDEYTEPETIHKPASVNRKKNKPMKAVEQEERIQRLEAQLNQFKEGSGSEQQSPNSTNSPASQPYSTANTRADQQEETSADESESSEEE
jgi:hypothetical protein